MFYYHGLVPLRVVSDDSIAVIEMVYVRAPKQLLINRLRVGRELNKFKVIALPPSQKLPNIGLLYLSRMLITFMRA